MSTPNSPTSSPKHDAPDSFPAGAASADVDPGGSRKKKRSKLTRVSSSSAAGGDSGGYYKPRVKKQEGILISESDHQVARPCTECGKQFSSWKALFGHMRCHPERQWRGINPPPNFRRTGPFEPAGGSSSSINNSNYNYPSDNINIIPPPPINFTEEDREMAACLILMANGTTTTTTTITTSTSACNASPDHSLEEAAEPSGCRFECSGCKKVFGSHQALGGHRASHKNVKGCFAIKRNDEEEDDDYVDVGEYSGERGGEGDGIRMREEHRCGICLRVFPTGQALGGHKRCHWEKGEEAAGGSTSASTVHRGCGIDLNLPAPPEKEGTSASTLVLDLRL